METLLVLLDEKAEHRSGDERKRCMREALVDHERRKSGTLMDLTAKRKAQFGWAAALVAVA